MTQTPDIWMLHTSQAGEGESQWGGCYAVEAHAHNDAAAMREATGMDWTVVPMVRADRPAQCLHQIAEPAAISEGEAFQALSELTNALRERHYGRMPSEVQAAYDKAWTIVFAGEKRAPVTQQAPAHPDDAAVDALAALMKAKLAEKRAKGYGGWNDKTLCPQQRLSDMLRAHVDKGDPVDVANFCAMLSARGEGIAPAPQAVQAAVPDDVERKAFEAWAQRHYRNADAYTYSDYLMGFEGWKARAALAATQPAAQGMDALTPAVRDVLAERKRQIEQEGYDTEHDDGHINDEIAAMAAIYLMPEAAREWDASSTSYGATMAEALLPADWNFPRLGTRRDQLVKGVAMGLAEIERTDRGDRHA